MTRGRLLIAALVLALIAAFFVLGLDSPGDILSPGLIISIALIGLLPLLAPRAAGWLKARRALRGHARPQRFDRNLVVIGAGSAGLVSAYLAAAMKARVTLIERHRMGGDCLNTGCVPSKALIRSARFVAQTRRARDYGMKSASVEFDFADVMERVQEVIRRIEPHDSVERYTRLGVECIEGQARIASPWSVEVGGRSLTTRAIVIATGGAPFVPPIPGLNTAGYLTSESIWSLRELPRRLTVLGGGPIGCELAQSFARLGSDVTIVEQAPRLLMREDEDVSERLLAALRAEGVDVRAGHRALECLVEGNAKTLVCERSGEQVRIGFDALLVAVGRTAVTDGLGIEALGIGLNERGNIEHDAFLRTAVPNILVCGDVAGPYQFTHTASHEAWYATLNALFGHLWRFKADYSVIPWCTFTEPEIATVGLNELAAKERGVDYELTEYDLADLDRAIADGEARGIVKVLTAPGRDRILGASIVGDHAGELITEFVTAMRHGLGLGKILGTIHVYPTLSEANKNAAGAWRRAHAPVRMMPWLARYHAWRRSGGLKGNGG
jgi:pyruvate/2-oxoglutarate dehydrogenase complex dihydrolipoamide dehydrogenase (E3) component